MAMAKLVVGAVVLLLPEVLRVRSDSTTATPVPCDDGWVSYNNYCYYFNNKKWITADQAAHECDRQGASLLYLSTADELNWYKQAVTSHQAPGYWTSLNDIANNVPGNVGTGFWKWGKYTNTDMSLITWNQSPANDGVANCAGINIQGKMADVGCRARMGYLCKLVPGDGVGCPLGWLPTDTTCYWVSNTTDPSQRMSWDNAKTKCASLFTGATLMSIDNTEDQNFLSGELPYLSQNTRLHWTGLVRRNNVWVFDNGNPVNTNLFTWQKEPDNIRGNENCGVIRMTGVFSDRSCKSRSNYICKKPQDMYYPSDNIGCGPWLRAGRYCYSFGRSKHLAWQDARAYCLSQNADLIKVDSIDKKSWLELQMTDPENNRVLWTGLNDISVEGNYVWADGTAVNTSFINWNQEPNDYKGDEDCALIYSSGEYNDVTCSTEAAAICELDNQASCPAGWLSRAADTGTGFNCYMLTPYKNASMIMSQSEASDYCYQMAVTSTAIPALLSVSSQSEKTFIKSTISKMTDNPYGWWTSLNDKQSEGFWAFGDNTLDQSLIDWQGEPNTASPDNDCGMLNWAGAYHEIPCRARIGYICERPAYGVSFTPTATGAGTTHDRSYLLILLIGLISDCL